MSETIKKDVTVSRKEWEVGKEKSKELYGRINFSGYIAYLIRKDNKDKFK